MKLFRFAGYVFDSGRMQLFRHGRRQPLRQKTARLLEYFLEQPGVVLSKSQICLHVWRRELVSDQSLFQAISELRRGLGGLDPAIVTHPNLGYEWVPAVSRVDAPRTGLRRLPVLAAALAALLLTASGPLSPGSPLAPAPAPVAAGEGLGLPAMRAFARGVERLEAGRAGEAAHYLRIALLENPSFHEAALLRAEALLLLGQYDEVRHEADALMLAVAPSAPTERAYVEVAVSDLLSRLSARTGRDDLAVQWSRTALVQALAHDFACAAAESGDRLAALLDTPAADDEDSQRLAQASDAAPRHCEEIGDLGPAIDSPACLDPAVLHDESAIRTTRLGRQRLV